MGAISSNKGNHCVRMNLKDENTNCRVYEAGLAGKFQNSWRQRTSKNMHLL